MCIYSFITLVSCFVYFERAGSLGFSGGPGHIFFCMGPRCVECRAGIIYLSASLGRVAGGTVQAFPFSGFVVVGTVRLK